MHLKRAISTIVATALVAAACGGTAATSRPSAGAASLVVPSAGATSAEACSMLTMAQVGSAIDFTVNTQMSDDGGLGCTWTYADPNLMVGFNTAKLHIIDSATFSITQRDQSGGSTVTLVSGLGDAAYFVEGGTGGTSLSVEKGSLDFTVSVLGTAYTVAQSEADEKTLAGFVLARI